MSTRRVIRHVSTPIGGWPVGSPEAWAAIQRVKAFIAVRPNYHAEPFTIEPDAEQRAKTKRAALPRA
ncbi:MAG: hypothetical protein ACR2M1_10450 [Gemmatimonadaceae bacterium]